MFTTILSLLLILCSSIHATEEDDELVRYNQLREAMIEPSPIEAAVFYLETGNGYYETNHFELAMIAYNRACELVIPFEMDIRTEAKKLSREALIDFCDAFRGRLRCYIANGNDHDKFWLSQSQLLESIDPRMPKFEEFEDHTIVRTEEIWNEEDLELIKKTIDNDSVTIINDTDLLIMKKPCSSCCESCENGDECEDEDEQGRIEFEQNIEKKSSN